MLRKNLTRMLVVMLMATFLFPTIGNAADADLTTQQKYDALAEKGIFAGMADGSAGLDQNMNRAQFARVASLIIGLEDISATDTNIVTEKPFSDVELGLWYTDEIAAAKKAGVFVGNTDGTFNPKGDITVQELAVVVAGLLGLEVVEGATVDGAADWAAGYIKAIMNANVDFPTNYTEPATRQDLATVTFQTEKMVASSKEEAKKKAEEEAKKKAEEARKKLEEARKKLEEARKAAEQSSSTPTPTPSPSTIALNKINATVGTWTGVDETTFTHAGVTGVTSANLTAVKAALDADGTSPWTVPEIQAIVNAVIAKQAALDTINASGGTWTGVDETTFTNAGVTSVTSANLAAVKAALDADGTSPWTVSGIQAIVNAVINDSTKQAALDLINAASASLSWTGVDVTTFANADITGVTFEILSTMQIQVGLETNYTVARTSSEIQVIVDAAKQAIFEGAAVDLIFDYLQSNALGSAPDLQVFIDAGINGVDAFNIEAILSTLVDAYNEGLSHQPGTTPMSPIKSDIQKVVDSYLNPPE